MPWAEVTVGTESLGKKSSDKIPLEPGEHVVVFEHPDYRPLRRKITILPGETLRLVLDLAEEAIRK